MANYCFSSATGSEVPIPSHFTADKFTLAQMENFDHADRSSPTCLKSNHDTIMILTQIKLEKMLIFQKQEKMDLGNFLVIIFVTITEKLKTFL